MRVFPARPAGQSGYAGRVGRRRVEPLLLLLPGRSSRAPGSRRYGGCSGSSVSGRRCRWCPLAIETTAVDLFATVVAAGAGRSGAVGRRHPSLLLLLLQLLLLLLVMAQHGSFQRSPPVQEHVLVEKVAQRAQAAQDGVEDGRQVSRTHQTRCGNGADERRERRRWADVGAD